MVFVYISKEMMTIVYISKEMMTIKQNGVCLHQ